MDQIFLTGIEVKAVVGVHDWERRIRRPLRIDLELGTDTRAAAASDRVDDAVDYAAVAELVVSQAGTLQPALLETLADQLAEKLFEAFPIQTLRLRIDKPGAVAGLKAVGVAIERRREDYSA